MSLLLCDRISFLAALGLAIPLSVSKHSNVEKIIYLFDTHRPLERWTSPVTFFAPNTLALLRTAKVIKIWKSRLHVWSRLWIIAWYYLPSLCRWAGCHCTHPFKVIGWIGSCLQGAQVCTFFFVSFSFSYIIVSVDSLIRLWRVVSSVPERGHWHSSFALYFLI